MREPGKAEIAGNRQRKAVWVRTARFTVSAARRRGHLPGQGAEAGFVIGTCAFGYVEGVFLKGLK